MCLLDMDYPIDGGDAIVVTTMERARDMTDRPVSVDAISYGCWNHAEVDKFEDLEHVGQTVAMKRLDEKTDIRCWDVNVVFPYDGFTIICMKWLESFGFCGVGEGPSFVKEQWSAEETRMLIRGKVPVNPHGGARKERSKARAICVKRYFSSKEEQGFDRCLPRKRPFWGSEVCFGTRPPSFCVHKFQVSESKTKEGEILEWLHQYRSSTSIVMSRETEDLWTSRLPRSVWIRLLTSSGTR